MIEIKNLEPGIKTNNVGLPSEEVEGAQIILEPQSFLQYEDVISEDNIYIIYDNGIIDKEYSVEKINKLLLEDKQIFSLSFSYPLNLSFTFTAPTTNNYLVTNLNPIKLQLWANLVNIGPFTRVETRINNNHFLLNEEKDFIHSFDFINGIYTLEEEGKEKIEFNLSDSLFLEKNKKYTFQIQGEFKVRLRFENFGFKQEDFSPYENSSFINYFYPPFSTDVSSDSNKIDNLFLQNGIEINDEGKIYYSNDEIQEVSLVTPPIIFNTNLKEKYEQINNLTPYTFSDSKKQIFSLQEENYNNLSLSDNFGLLVFVSPEDSKIGLTLKEKPTYTKTWSFEVLNNDNEQSTAIACLANFNQQVPDIFFREKISFLERTKDIKIYDNTNEEIFLQNPNIDQFNIKDLAYFTFTIPTFEKNFKSSEKGKYKISKLIKLNYYPFFLSKVNNETIKINSDTPGEVFEATTFYDTILFPISEDLTIEHKALSSINMEAISIYDEDENEISIDGEEVLLEKDKEYKIIIEGQTIRVSLNTGSIKEMIYYYDDGENASGLVPKFSSPLHYFFNFDGWDKREGGEYYEYHPYFIALNEEPSLISPPGIVNTSKKGSGSAFYYEYNYDVIKYGISSKLETAFAFFVYFDLDNCNIELSLTEEAKDIPLEISYFHNNNFSSGGYICEMNVVDHLGQEREAEKLEENLIDLTDIVEKNDEEKIYYSQEIKIKYGAIDQSVNFIASESTLYSFNFSSTLNFIAAGLTNINNSYTGGTIDQPVFLSTMEKMIDAEEETTLIQSYEQTDFDFTIRDKETMEIIYPIKENSNSFLLIKDKEYIITMNPIINFSLFLSDLNYNYSWSGDATPNLASYFNYYDNSNGYYYDNFFALSADNDSYKIFLKNYGENGFIYEKELSRDIGNFTWLGLLIDPESAKVVINVTKNKVLNTIDVPKIVNREKYEYSVPYSEIPLKGQYLVFLKNNDKVLAYSGVELYNYNSPPILEIQQIKVKSNNFNSEVRYTYISSNKMLYYQAKLIDNSTNKIIYNTGKIYSSDPNIILRYNLLPKEKYYWEIYAVDNKNIKSNIYKSQIISTDAQETKINFTYKFIDKKISESFIYLNLNNFGEGGQAIFPQITQFPSTTLFPSLEYTASTYKKIKILREDITSKQSIWIGEYNMPSEGGLKIYDYGIKANVPYNYWGYVTLEDDSLNGIKLNDEPIMAEWDRWTLVTTDKDSEDEKVYHVDKVFTFEMNLSSGSMTNGTNITTSKNFTEFPVIQKDKSNFYSGSLTALMGVRKKGSTAEDFEQTPHMLEELRQLSTNYQPKFLKDRSGHLWQVEINGAIQVANTDNLATIDLKTMTVPWVQIGEADDISLIYTGTELKEELYC